jgi:hypothetical protein
MDEIAVPISRPTPRAASPARSAGRRHDQRGHRREEQELGAGVRHAQREQIAAKTHRKNPAKTPITTPRTTFTVEDIPPESMGW